MSETGDRVDEIIGAEIKKTERQEQIEAIRDKITRRTPHKRTDYPGATPWNTADAKAERSLGMHVPEWWNAWQAYVAANPWLEQADAELWSRCEKTWAAAWGASELAPETRVRARQQRQLAEQDAKTRSEDDERRDIHREQMIGGRGYPATFAEAQEQQRRPDTLTVEEPYVPAWKLLPDCEYQAGQMVCWLKKHDAHSIDHVLVDPFSRAGQETLKSDPPADTL